MESKQEIKKVDVKKEKASKPKGKFHQIINTCIIGDKEFKKGDDFEVKSEKVEAFLRSRKLIK